MFNRIKNNAAIMCGMISVFNADSNVAVLYHALTEE